MESARYDDCLKPSKLPARHADCAHFLESVSLLPGFASSGTTHSGYGLDRKPAGRRIMCSVHPHLVDRPAAAYFFFAALCFFMPALRNLTALRGPPVPVIRNFFPRCLLYEMKNSSSCESSVLLTSSIVLRSS
jgi:hypothetical protein